MEDLQPTIRFILVILGASSVVHTTKAEGMLPTYNGALTEITCAANVPTFLVNGVYSSLLYHQLPDLFGIEARVATDRSNVTLHINGNILAHNVTVECQNIVDPVTGQTETMFQLTLSFADTIPAPYSLQYDDRNGLLSWSPPLLKASHSVNVTVTLRITHYIIYIIDQTNGLTTNFTTTGPETSIAVFTVMPTMPCSMSIEVSAVNPAGEGQMSPSITVTDNQCSPDHDIVTRPEDSTTQDIDNEKESSAKQIALSAGGIIAVVIAILFVAFIVVCIMILLIVCSFTKNRNTKSKAVNEEELSKPRSQSETSESSELSQTAELLTPDSSSPSTPKQPTMMQHQLQCLQNSQDTSNSNQGKKRVQCTQDGQLIYAELAPSVLNPISQPSSVDSTTYAVINTTNQTSNSVYTH